MNRELASGPARPDDSLLGLLVGGVIGLLAGGLVELALDWFVDLFRKV